ncbi:hypothetical protein [Pelagicoccus sp. SDUM812005]|uniref:hypothetical protein n=1 Tax=Pelagicoccus sp. SDUM812005 TaxID=3041257 RepID=UPI00280F68AF|nr:hypothetical protein [Pelagicoccus sp. SDUM812005]MDQ8180177.1 hypothetical protein [Pelagicoccus sp. SDUM812005]
MKILLALFIALFTSAFAQAAKHEPVPFPEEVAQVGYKMVSGLLRKGTEIPSGCYTDEESRTVFSGHQKGMNASILFGPIGVIAANQANKAGGRERSESFNPFAGFEVEDLVEEKILAEFSANAVGVLVEGQSERTLEFCPYVILNRNEKTGTKIYILCIVELKREGSSKPLWRTRFYSELPGVFSDADLADSDEVAALCEAPAERLAWAIRKAVTMDFSQYLPRKVKARFAGMPNNGLPFAGAVVDELGDFKLMRMVYCFPPSYTVAHVDSLAFSDIKKFKDKHRDAFLAAAAEPGAEGSD